MNLGGERRKKTVAAKDLKREKEFFPSFLFSSFSPGVLLLLTEEKMNEGGLGRKEEKK